MDIIIIVAIFGFIALSLGGLFVLICVVKWLLFPNVPREKQYVTQEELKTAITELKNDITTKLNNHSDKLNDQSEYTHKFAHDTRDTLHGIGLQLDTLVRLEKQRAEILPKKG